MITTLQKRKPYRSHGAVAYGPRGTDRSPRPRPFVRSATSKSDGATSSENRRLPYVHHPSFHASGAAGKYREFSPACFSTPDASESFSPDSGSESAPLGRKREDALQDAFLHLNYRRWVIAELNSDEGRLSTTALETRLTTLRREVDEIRNWIIEQNQPLIAILSSRYLQAGVTLDELRSEAYTVLIRAIDRFDVQRGVLFSTYASTAINRHLQRWLGTRSKSQQGSLQELELEPVSRQSPSATKDLEQEATIHGALKTLPGVLRRIVRLRFGLGDRGKPLSFQAIAERLGMNRERVRRLCKTALERLRSHPGLRQFDPSG